MARILVVYGTRQGHAAHLAERIANGLRAGAHDVDVRDLKGSNPDVHAYDAVVVGASVHMRGFEREVLHWTRDRAEDLLHVPNAFFSVSLASANDDEKSKAEVDEVVADFVEKTTWRPQRVAHFAGALVYSQYNWLVKRVMRWIVKRESGGQYQDMSRDYDLTDYAAVDAFARELATSITANTAQHMTRDPVA